MSTSRAESQVSQFGRRRSNTVQSIHKNPPLPATPLKVGDSKTFTTWVHEPKESTNVILNPDHWPGVTEGDVLRLSSGSEASSGFLFIVQRDEGLKRQLQVSVPQSAADQFQLKNMSEVTLTKIDQTQYSADYIELTFQDQYLGRNEMWRLGSDLVGQCVYIEQEISFIGVITAKVHAIYINGKKVPAAYVSPATKAIYRSLSAKVTIFIQVCRELWEFAGDGERYNEKIVHSFLPALFAKWSASNTNHIVTIVLISRVFYDESELKDAAGPLRRDEEGRSYKDFFKVITDLEVLSDWKPTLVDLKTSFWEFQRDILLAHHYHRPSSSSQVEPEHVRLVGQLSYAHDGPLLEALNLGLQPTETHYIDRSLSLTGSSTIVITPGTGYFRVSKSLLRLTTTRVLDQGFGVGLVSLTKPPLHQSSIFAFQGVEPDQASRYGARALDPLWGGDGIGESSNFVKTIFWWEPFWMSVSYWDKQMDLPFREDRFVSRAKMHEIERLGLLDHDVLSNIEIPFLPAPEAMTSSFTSAESISRAVSQEEADAFDVDIFAPIASDSPAVTSRNSVSSLTSSAPTVISSRLTESLKRSSLTSESSMSSVMEESVQQIAIGDSTSEVENRFLSAAMNTLSTSPSQSSMRSVRSARSQNSTISARSPTSPRLRATKLNVSVANAKASSRLTPAWLFSPFRSGPSQPQTSPVSVSTLSASPNKVSSASPIKPSTTTAVPSQPRLPFPSTAQPVSSTQSRHVQRASAEPSNGHRDSFDRPVAATTPKDESVVSKRRTLSKTTSISLPTTVPSAVRTNPSKPQSTSNYAQSSLARRWQHIFPGPISKHEIKWKAMVMPGCLPLSTEQLPSTSELETAYDMFSYEFVIDPLEMRPFLVRPPASAQSAEETREQWALVVMRGMVAVRLAQGFQFVLRPSKSDPHEAGVHDALRRSRSYIVEDEYSSRPVGVRDALKSPYEPIYLTMSNEIHRVSCSGDIVQVRRYVRRMSRSQPIEYQCLIWPKLGVGYTELSTSFNSHGLENYGWNRLDMLAAGYENEFNESIRYWRTRFVEELNDEEVRLLGIDKLAELFTKARWYPPDERVTQAPPVRFLTTDLDPAACVRDESLMAELDEIHAAGPLRKKVKSDRMIAGMSLSAIVKAMREEGGVPIKDYSWHGRKYANSFKGHDFVSWLVREFRDVSSREEGTKWGASLQEQGLFDHGRQQHGFLDGHYFYILAPEYLAPPTTPRTVWGPFRSRHVSGEESSIKPMTPLEMSSASTPKAKKRLILSQSMVIDVDPNKRSNQAESVVLHHDIIHNPATCFHFELQWIGTTARCIDDLLRQWTRTIEKYGLRLVEAYVTQICDIRDRNPFQSCFPLPLIEPPPIISNLQERVPDGIQAKHYFEYALLRKHGFVCLDIEAANLYPDQIDVVYSYRRAPVKYSQWVHRSGVAFVQVLGASDGFLFLTNRLMAPGRIGTAIKFHRPEAEVLPAVAADKIRVKLQRFCSDRAALTRFYQEEIDKLKLKPEDPPALHI